MIACTGTNRPAKSSPHGPIQMQKILYPLALGTGVEQAGLPLRCLRPPYLRWVNATDVAVLSGRRGTPSRTCARTVGSKSADQFPAWLARWREILRTDWIVKGQNIDARVDSAVAGLFASPSSIAYKLALSLSREYPPAPGSQETTSGLTSRSLWREPSLSELQRRFPRSKFDEKLLSHIPASYLVRKKKTNDPYLTSIKDPKDQSVRLEAKTREEILARWTSIAALHRQLWGLSHDSSRTNNDNFAPRRSRPQDLPTVPGADSGHLALDWISDPPSPPDIASIRSFMISEVVNQLLRSATRNKKISVTAVVNALNGGSRVARFTAQEVRATLLSQDVVYRPNVHNVLVADRSVQARTAGRDGFGEAAVNLRFSRVEHILC